MDDFPWGEIIKEQKSSANTSTIQITWMNNSIEVLKKGVEFSYCRHILSNHELWIKNDIIFKAREGMRCYDFTDYFIEAGKGDIVSIIEIAKERTLVKKDGVIGWVRNECLGQSEKMIL